MYRPKLADLAAFSAVANHRSFREASDLLGMSRSRVSHTILTLERNLGVRLFNRTTRSVALTEAGERLLERLKPALQDINDAIDAVVDDGGYLGGTLRISGGESGIRRLMARIVPCFLDSYPNVSLDIVVQGNLVDIVEDGFDAGIRLAEAVPRDMVAIPIGEDLRFIAVASPAYLANNPAPRVPDDLQRHRCIRQRLPSGKMYRWEFEKHGGEISVEVPGALTLNHTLIIVDAAADGMGIAYVPETSARPWIKNGRLVALLEDWSPPVPGLRLYYPGHRHVPPALRAFIATIKTADGAKELSAAPN
jgi:DNA-binding transcriptional LysR family regulator